MLCGKPRWGKSLRENGYMYMYSLVPSLFTWNYYKIVNWLYPNTKLKVKKKSKKRERERETARRPQKVVVTVGEGEGKDGHWRPWWPRDVHSADAERTLLRSDHKGTLGRFQRSHLKTRWCGLELGGDGCQRWRSEMAVLEQGGSRRPSVLWVECGF